MREALESAAAPRWGRQTNVHQPRSSLAQLQLDSPQGSRLTLPIPPPRKYLTNVRKSSWILIGGGLQYTERRDNSICLKQ